METFGARLSRLRREKGLKRSDIAEPLGMDAETVARYERDEREPKIGDAAVIAGILGVSLEYLASGVSSVQSHVFADGSGDWLLIPVLRAAEFFDAAPSKNSIAGCTDNIAVPRSIVGAVDVERPPFAFVTHDGSFEKFSIRAGSCVVVNPAEQVSDFDIALILIGRDGYDVVSVELIVEIVGEEIVVPLVFLRHRAGDDDEGDIAGKAHRGPHEPGGKAAGKDDNQ